MAETAEDTTWYVAITRLAGWNRYHYFIGAGSAFYRGYAEMAKKGGVEVVAEQFDVDAETVNRLDGFYRDGKRIATNILTDLVIRADTEEGLDIKKALAELCKKRLDSSVQ